MKSYLLEGLPLYDIINPNPINEETLFKELDEATEKDKKKEILQKILSFTVDQR